MARTVLAAAAFCALAASALAVHYEDPNTKSGCGSDEQKIQIQGVAGDLCSPACVNGTCPTDVPAGVTAKPQCALSSPSGGKFCALICTPSGVVPTEELLRAGDAQCGKNASCKSIQGSGICTYDDIPPPPSSAHWKPVNSPTFEALTVIDVAFTADGKTGFAGAGANGVGAEIMKTTNGGVDWNRVWPTSSNGTAMNLFLASAVKEDDAVVVAGVFFREYSTDGNTFETSTNGILSPAQDAHVLPSGDFGLVGEFGGNASNGVSISPDGKTWKPLNMPNVNSTLFPARYGSFPSEKVWYLTAGLFPSNNVEARADAAKRGIHRVTEDVSVSGGKFEYRFDDVETDDGGGPVKCEQDPDNCYSASIQKTMDGGATWTTVYTSINNGENIYPNGIDCFSELHCVAVLEGDTARIVVTHDGGHTWNETMHDTDSKSSLVAVRMLSETEVWASGGHMTYSDFEGRFWHSLDGGATWVKEAIPDLYIIAFDLINSDSGYAVALTIQQGNELLKYDASGSA